VIDFLDKYESYYDPYQNIKGIRRVKISEAEQIQRRRRTGRDCQGIYIPILIDNSSESSITPEGDDNIVTQGPLKYPIPSIEREELSGILLRLRAHQVDLEKLPLFHSPDQDIITQSLKNLKAINCIDGNGNITNIGRAASRFSILYPSAARIVLEAMALFPDLPDLMYEALLVACILNAGGIIDRHKFERTEKPRWLNIEGAKSFKSDLLLQAHILKNELKVFDTRAIFPDKYITDLQLVPKQIKTIMRDYDELKKLLSSPDMSDLLNKACQMIQLNLQSQSHNELSSDNERLRYCIFISLSTSLCFNARQLHVDEFFTMKALRSYGHTLKADLGYFPYCSRRSSSDIFKPEQRQCLLKYQDSEPGWIVANLFQHLGKPTLSLYTEIEPQWIIAKNVYQNCTVGMRDLVFCSQGRCKWQRVKFQIDQDVVVDYQVEKEGKNVKPIEVLAESIRCYGQVRDLKHLLLQFENPTIKPESFLNLSDITSSSFKKGYVIEGRIAGLKPYGAFIDIGDKYGLLHISNISHASIEILHEVFKVDEVIKIMILDIDEERERILLSLKELEPEPGDILKNRNLVFERAEEMAARYRREQGIDEILSERENEITESDEFDKIDLLKVKRLTNYVIARLYSFVREFITRHQDTWTDSTESDLLAQVCFEWTSNCLAKLPQDWSLDSVKKKHLDEIITSVIERKRLPN
jgi:predicted RNA-binding protein with RPS1 domain